MDVCDGCVGVLGGCADDDCGGGGRVVVKEVLGVREVFRIRELLGS